jgi:hypothetical protein
MNSAIADRIFMASGIGLTGTLPQAQFLVTLMDFVPIFASWKKGTPHVGQDGIAIPLR